MPDATLVCSGLVERIGTDETILVHKVFKGTEEVVLKKERPIAIL